MRKVILFIIFFILVIAIFGYYQAESGLTLVGRYFSPSDQLSKADAIVVVSGSNERFTHALSLYKEGFAHKLIFSGAASEGPTSNAKAWKTAAIKDGVPEADIITEEKATNTYENALFTKDIILDNRFKQIILVSSPYHQRRAYESFKKVLKEYDVVIQNSPATSSSWKADNWWQSKSGMQKTISETAKIIWLKTSIPNVF